MATAFCKETEPLEEEDALDAAGEFLNWVNGLYATALSRSGMDSELMPPILINEGRFINDDTICGCSIPVFMGDKKAIFIVIGRK